MRRVPYLGAEKESLVVALDRHRDVVVWKLAGLDEAAAREPRTPSGTTLLGLVKHLAAVEFGWFAETFGRPSELPPFDPQDPDADFRLGPDDTVATVLAFYARARESSDDVVASHALDDTGTDFRGPVVSLRWVLIHMVEETARHAGHLDILRELADGAAGDHPRTDA